MKDETLYPELIDYIFSYCRKYFYEAEKKADRHLLAMEKSGQGAIKAKYKFYMKEENIYTDNVIVDLVKDGFKSFKSRVATRIYNEHKHELELNLCPQCNKIARTPQAKQCRFCYCDWH